MKQQDHWPGAQTGLLDSAWRRWRDTAEREGRIRATWRLLAAVWGFLRDSTPERRRQRYGDAEFDWDHRVDTTSGTVTWHNRLLGVFHSPYQPTEAALFHEMLDALGAQTHCDFSDFVFIDLGSGKGRVLLMAADYPFQRIVGIELLPELHRAAQENIAKYKSESQKCFALETICEDAVDFHFPDEPFVLYLFNPLPEPGLRRVIATLEQSLHTQPQAVYLLYHNPLLEHVLSGSAMLKKIGGTHQYAMYSSK